MSSWWVIPNFLSNFLYRHNLFGQGIPKNPYAQQRFIKKKIHTLERKILKNSSDKDFKSLLQARLDHRKLSKHIVARGYKTDVDEQNKLKSRLRKIVNDANISIDEISETHTNMSDALKIKLDIKLLEHENEFNRLSEELQDKIAALKNGLRQIPKEELLHHLLLYLQLACLNHKFSPSNMENGVLYLICGAWFL